MGASVFGQGMHPNKPKPEMVCTKRYDPKDICSISGGAYLGPNVVNRDARYQLSPAFLIESLPKDDIHARRFQSRRLITAQILRAASNCPN